MRWLLRPSRLVLILSALAIATVPSLRREFSWNLRALLVAIPHWPSSDYAACILGGETAPGLRPYDPEAELDAHPRDLQLRMALARDHWNVSSTIRNRALKEALALAPDERVVLSLSALRDLRGGELHFEREEALSVTRKDDAGWRKLVASGWREKLLRAEQISGVMRALDQWAGADWGNAGPDAIAAFLLLGAKRDEEALSRAESAGRKRHLTLYDLEISEAAAYAQRLRGLPAVEAQTVAIPVWTTATLHPEMRYFARMMSRIGWQHYKRGNKETAFRYWLATGGIGNLMSSYEREYLIPRMVGMAVQAIGYSPIYSRKSKSGDETQPPAQEIRPGPAYGPFVAARGKGAAERIREELSASLSLSRELRAVFPPTSRQQLALVGEYFFARRLAVTAMPAVLLAALLSLLTVLGGRRSKPSVSRLWSAVLVGIAILASTGLMLVTGAFAFANLFRSWEAEEPWYEFTFPDSPWFALAISAGPALLLTILLAIGAAWVARKKKIRYRTALGGAMRQTLPGLLAILAIIWIAATAVAVREGGIYARYMARQREVGEMRMLEEFAADRGIEIKHHRE